MKRRRNSVLTSAAVVLMLWPGPGKDAHALTYQQVGEANRFALGNAVWILYHEIGHLLVNEFELPVLGREEDAVDHLATVTLLEAATPEMDNYLIDAVDGFFLTARVKQQNDSERLFFAGHGLDEQRAFEVACLMLGNDPNAFSELADSIELPLEERERCEETYDLARSSWMAVLDPHQGGWLSRPSSEAIEISYGEAGTANTVAKAILEDEAVLESAATYLGQKFVFPRTVSLRAEACGEANAFFEPGPGTVVICYELVEEFRSLLAGYFEGL